MKYLTWYVTLRINRALLKARATFIECEITYSFISKNKHLAY